MIYILTGAIRSGKTTALLDWCASRTDVDGLLCPDGSEGKRYFLKLKSKTNFELETEIETEEVIAIGSFKFLKSAFKTANEYLLEAAKTKAFQYLILDELGKLELKNEGLHAAAQTLITTYKQDQTQHLILVVRDYLVDDIRKHYDITEYSLLNTTDLKLLK
ncbi:nucleoside-triphosphatase [Psychroserpens algicola]|uniref:Nucleoside-triphosphatase n=1 Tax=Psychroserpens algicola TaxID=1719034 RepID=A0ABT0H7W8_9FLAO|nr:nucleoside-triphosphatase [Psychroserpens algicola]MCK8480454.1 nucleoside-triphosphatase [Psychroserpens algicola]